MSFFHTYEFQSSFGHRRRGCIPVDRRGDRLDVRVSAEFEDPGLHDSPIGESRTDGQVAKALRELGRQYVVVKEYNYVDLQDEQVHQSNEILWEADDLIEHLENLEAQR